MTESKLETAIASLEKQVAVFGAQLGHIQAQVKETLQLVKETNGAVREHSSSIAGLKEWKIGVDRQHNKIDDRVWKLVAGGTIFAGVGSIVGIAVNLILR